MDERIQDPSQQPVANPFAYQTGPEWYSSTHNGQAPPTTYPFYGLRNLFGLASPEETAFRDGYQSMLQQWNYSNQNRMAHQGALDAELEKNRRQAPTWNQLTEDQLKATLPTAPLVQVQGPGAPVRPVQPQEPMYGLKPPAPYEAPGEGLAFRPMAPSNQGATEGPQLTSRHGVTTQNLDQKVSPYAQVLLKEESVRNIYQQKQEQLSADAASLLFRAAGHNISPQQLPAFMTGAEHHAMLTAMGQMAGPEDIRQSYLQAGVKMPVGADARPINAATLRNNIDVLSKANMPHSVDLETRLATTMAPDIKSFEQTEGRLVTPKDLERWAADGSFPEAKIGQTFRVALDAEIWRREQLKTKLYAENRVNADLNAPEEIGKRQNAVLKSDLSQGKITHAPVGISKRDLRTQGYVEMTDKQLEEWKELNKTNAAAMIMFEYADQLAKATTPLEALGERFTLYGGALAKSNTIAAAYLDAKEAWSSSMARAYGGEVGVMTNPDIKRWEITMYRFGDTVEIKEAKKALFHSIYKIARDAQVAMLAGDISPEEARAKVDLAMKEIRPQVDAVGKASEEAEKQAKSPGGKDAAKAQTLYSELEKQGVLAPPAPTQQPLTLPGQPMDETTPFNPGARPAPIDPSQVQRPTGVPQPTAQLQPPPQATQLQAPPGQMPAAPPPPVAAPVPPPMATGPGYGVPQPQVSPSRPSDIQQNPVRQDYLQPPVAPPGPPAMPSGAGYGVPQPNVSPSRPNAVMQSPTRPDYLQPLGPETSPAPPQTSQLAPPTTAREADAGTLPPIASLARQTRLGQDFRDRVEPIDFAMLKDSYDIYRHNHNLQDLKADVHKVLGAYYEGPDLADAERSLLNTMLSMKDFPMNPPPSSRKGKGRRKKVAQ